MRVFNCIFEDILHLNTFIDENLNFSYQSLLIQVFSGVLDESKVKTVLETLLNKLPDANIIGTSTSGEVLNGEMHDNAIAISFSCFDSVQIKTYHSKVVDFNSGKEMANKVIEENTKAIICFSESLKSDPQNFFEGFETINSEIVIAGGNAGDNGLFQKTFVIKGTQIYDEGMVLCTLNSDTLIVNNQYTLNWLPLGKEMLITKVKDNVVYEINDTPILEVYKYYFGDEIEEGMPGSIVEFPLLKQENGTDIARSLVVLNEDKSFVFAGHFSVGDKVRFAVGNVNEVLNNAKSFSEKVSQKPIEGIYIYSCMVRKMFLDRELNSEFSLLNEIAPTSGFFTYGEFFNTGKSNQVLNISTTILSLSESKRVHAIKHDFNKKESSSTLRSLTHLVNVTEKELQEKIYLIEVTQNQLIASEKMASLGSLVSGIAHEINTPLGVSITGVSQVQHEVQMLEKAYNEKSLSETALKSYYNVSLFQDQ